MNREFLQNMWCALNCATTNDEVFEIMCLMEKHGGKALPKWQEYVGKKQDIFKTSMKEMGKFLSALGEKE